jgi:DeoR/GlpR family transcriptional regulator of sugar metabolism
MVQEDRRGAVLAHLERQGACSYEELAERMQVSSMTIRRDIDKLARTRAVIKILGGAQRANAPSELYELQLASRLSSQNAEKQAIAAQALGVIKPGETIFLDGSTTCVELAKLLSRKVENLTVITNSFLISREISRNRNVTTLVIGGEYDRGTMCCAGASGEDQAKRFFVEKAFMSTRGFLPSEGTFESSVGLFRIKQMLAKQSSKVILLVDHSKFGQRSLCKVLDISQIDTVITDEGTSEDDLKLLKKAGRNVLVSPKELCQSEAVEHAT